MSHGHHPHADGNDPFQKRVAVAMALFTVLVAFNSMLTNQARTQALLLSNEATNQWAYYQAKSTKQALVKTTVEILGHLPRPATQVEPAGGAEPKTEDALATSIEKLNKDAERYESEKEKIKEKGDEITEHGLHQQHKEHWYEYATVAAELALIIASVALLMSSRAAFALSGACAVCSTALTAWTALH